MYRFCVLLVAVSGLLVGCMDLSELGWTDCAAVSSNFNAVALSETGAYIPNPWDHEPYGLPGIGCAYMDWGPEFTDEVRVSVLWAGKFPLEGAPLVHVNPTTDTFGIGAWPAHDVGNVGDGLLYPLLFLGTIGNPPDQFAVLNAGAFVHVDGTPRTIEIRSSNGYVSAWMENLTTHEMEQVVPPTAIPEEHLGSSLHGFAIDTHFATSCHPPTEAWLVGEDAKAEVVLDVDVTEMN